MTEKVILVDEKDCVTGGMEKMEAHRKGLLHRAFSVFIFNSKGELLLQQRARSKYHSAGLWTNTCCSHPRFGEETASAAVRRLKEEMGMTCELQPVFNFIYKAKLDNGLIEHEYDHVFFGTSDVLPKIELKEVQNWKYMSMNLLFEDINSNPGVYTVWLKHSFADVRECFNNLGSL